MGWGWGWWFDRWAIFVRGNFVWLNGIIIRVLGVRVPYFKTILSIKYNKLAAFFEMAFSKLLSVSLSKACQNESKIYY